MAIKREIQCWADKEAQTRAKHLQSNFAMFFEVNIEPISKIT